jgi:hypothetical protein
MRFSAHTTHEYYLAHRVGYRISDAQRPDAAPDQRTLAHQEMCRTISDAWKHPPAQPASDAQMAHNATKPQRRVASMADANEVRLAAYQEYLTWLKDAYRGTTK